MAEEKQTSIHIRPVKPGSEQHNRRVKKLDYIRADLSSQNESRYTKFKSGEVVSIKKNLELIKKDYAAHHGGKSLPKNATPIREAVVVIKDNTTIKELTAATKQMRERFGLTAIQVFTHKDEGHENNEGNWIPNLHAHIVFNWYDFNTHTTIKLNKYDCMEMQDIFAECLGMARGKSSDKKHLNAIQQKIEAEQKRLAELQENIRNWEKIRDDYQLAAEYAQTEAEADIKTLRENLEKAEKAFSTAEIKENEFVDELKKKKDENKAVKAVSRKKARKPSFGPKIA